ncbi:hypothetical protein N7493_011906 [Penicillium malachiteum]|uniref:Uncharacterized protein n=1 Tax=Penicillium malachiteum TaxID=1324776 RepID=A0AAD6HAN1_9EURO|nr:hypothetical protein N7493_011906 [Penicillium malachiteum]
MRCICGHRSDSESPSPTPEEQRQQQQEQPAPQGTETGIELQDLPATPDPNRTRPADPADGETEPAPKRQKPNPKPEPAPAPVPASAPIPIPSAVPRPVPKESVVVETERDPVSDIEWLRQRGTQIVGWMDNPDLPDCPVQRSTLTLAQIQANQDAVFTRFGTPPDASFLDYESYADDPHNCVAWSIWFGMDLWVGMTARGVIVMANISRTWGSQHPFTSDIALALYAHQFGTTDSLRHIFFNGVVNTQTRGLISNYLYTNQFEPDVRDWEYGSQGYLALMGTRIGRVAAYTVLGAFPRGTHRISRVVTDFEPGALSVEMRFDIEAISGSG